MEISIREASESYFFFKDNYDGEEYFYADYDFDEQSASAYISEFIIHPDWDPEDTHYGADIAIAILKQPIRLSNEIRHVCLNTPSNPIQNFAGKKGMVYGWGLTEELELDTKLHEVEVPLVNQAFCKNDALSGIMSDTSFCTGARDGKTGPCNGKV
jgi:hypothetical protein